ncbi:glycosyltransferase family 2 protein [Patescibacteria group bacterium]
MQSNISIITLTLNNEKSLEECLKSVSWADEIIIVDEGSKDKTLEIAKKFNSKIVKTNEIRFDKKRNLGFKKASNKWLFYLDSDEIISPQLKKEILQIVKQNKIGTYEVKRENYFLGKKMYHDKNTRLFHKSLHSGWVGKVHETPIYNGKKEKLKSLLTHNTHTDIYSMLEKTNKWSAFEAELRYEANHPPVKAWRVVRIAITEFYNQFFKKRVFKYGAAGWIEGVFQVVDKTIVYIKLWELQQK